MLQDHAYASTKYSTSFKILSKKGQRPGNQLLWALRLWHQYMIWILFAYGMGKRSGNYFNTLTLLITLFKFVTKFQDGTEAKSWVASKAKSLCLFQFVHLPITSTCDKIAHAGECLRIVPCHFLSLMFGPHIQRLLCLLQVESSISYILRTDVR